MNIHPIDPIPKLRLLRNLRAVCAQARQRGDVPTARAALDEEESLSVRITELEAQLSPSETSDKREAA